MLQLDAMLHKIEGLPEIEAHSHYTEQGRQEDAPLVTLAGHPTRKKRTTVVDQAVSLYRVQPCINK
jgi:hypothetical protein